MNSRTKIIGLYHYPKRKTLGEWQRQHRRMMVCDPLYRSHVYWCLGVWFLTCFVPLVYFALFPTSFLALGRRAWLFVGLQLLFGAAAWLFLRRSRRRALMRHPEV